jgi:hypothetical protein
MSLKNGEKARAAITRKNRNAQREKDRARRAELAKNASSKEKKS